MNRVGVKVTVKSNTAAVKRAVQAGAIKSLGHAGAYLRQIAVRSIGRNKKPSEPGTPPHSRTGRLKRSILYAVNKAEGTVYIGPSRSVIGTIARTHEFGGSEPPKVQKRRSGRAFAFVVGGIGPVRLIGRSGKKFIVAKLKTEKQVRRAATLAKDIPPSKGGPPSKRKRRYPKRPIMARALKVGRVRLAKFFERSVKG